MYAFSLLRSIELALSLSLAFCKSPIDTTPTTQLFSRYSYEDTAAMSAATGVASLQDALTDQLSSGAEVYIQGQAGFENLTLRWQKYRKPNFAIAVAVATENDVIETVKFANGHDVPFLAVSGGHGATDALGAFQDGIGIFMHNLNEIDIDTQSNTAKIGGGTSSFDVSHALWKEGKETVHGVCECTSLLGPMLGGGHGFLQGQYGLAADQLVSANVVLADGAVTTASQTSNPDLFWALRGAGHNFGIVTSVVYKIYDVSPGKDQWTSEAFIFAGNRTKEVFEVANKIVDVQPANYVHAVLMLCIPSINPNEPILEFVALYNGPREQAANISAPIRALSPISETVTEISYLDTPATWASSRNDPACQKGSNTTSFLRFPIDLESYNVDGMQTLYNQFAAGIREEPRFNNSFMLVEGYSTQGVRAIPADSTAVPFREKRLSISPAIAFIDDSDESLQQSAISWGQQMRSTLYNGAGGHDMLSYVNYAHGDEGPQAWYGHEAWRQEKLKALKKKWDPLNRFRSYAPIPLD